MFQKALLGWYEKHSRKGLPWRQTKDPYRIWVSETMLQQTQVATVIPYYERFLKTFPTLEALAQAPAGEVLDSWSGLGYYSRAKHLHAAARAVAAQHGGRLPDDVGDLLKLPGIGRYTAGAVASIAYDRPAPVLDGNVIRVLCRYFGIREDPSRALTQRRMWELSARLVPQENPGRFNQALMELGALVCVPRDPDCPVCPVRSGCLARREGLQGVIPPRRPAPAKKRIRYLCGILQRGSTVLLARRPLSGLLPGLWEFPGGEKDPRESERESIRRHFRERLGIHIQPDRILAEVRQMLSHRELEIRAFGCRRTGGRLRPRWYTESRWVPKGDLLRRGLTAGMQKLACAALIAGCAAAGPPDARPRR